MIFYLTSLCRSHAASALEAGNADRGSTVSSTRTIPLFICTNTTQIPQRMCISKQRFPLFSIAFQVGAACVICTATALLVSVTQTVLQLKHHIPAKRWLLC